MATYRISIDDSRLRQRIKAMRDAAENLEPLHARIGAAILSDVQLGFRGSHAPDGTAWKPLKVRTGGQPLRDTGRLQNSITSAPDSTGVTVGTNVQYAAVHQFGATIKAKNGPFLVFPTGGGQFAKVKQVTIPARPFLPIDASGRPDLPDSYRDTIINRLRQHFLGQVVRD